MTFWVFLRERRWPTIFGYLLFIGMMAVGYFYNVTFIQLGLTDLCRRILGMSEQHTAHSMALLALLSLMVALGFGYWMMKTGRSAHFLLKVRFSFAVVVGQTLLTLLVTQVTSQVALFLWISFASMALGVGMPATFSLTVDLIPRRDRGIVAGLITAGAYFASNAFSSATWHIQHFRNLSLLVMLPGVLGMAVLVLARLPLLDVLAQQHQLPEFGIGRLVHKDDRGKFFLGRGLIGLLLMMFGVYFIDSLGFLRLLETPLYMQFAWQSTELNIHLFIAITHVVAALACGVLYSVLPERQLFLWVFSFFALAQLQYIFHTRFGPNDYAPLAMPMLYAIAVSLYTVINFAIWADMATPQTISFTAAIGVAFSGWAATFLSTALAIYLQDSGMTFEQHFEMVNSVSFVFFLIILLWPYFRVLLQPFQIKKEVRS